jgi:DNA-binding transcriptional regulator GbsR (MarR family)
MGATYGVVYLSPEPITLDELVKQVGITKGAISTSVRHLERLGMVKKHFIIGDRKDYYTAETDFWKIVKGILREREKVEFDQALSSVSNSLNILDEVDFDKQEKETADFYKKRMQEMKKLDKIVATILVLDELSDNTIRKIFGKQKKKD